MRTLHRAVITGTLVLLLQSPGALALQFWPTEAEWVTWPEYCRARYTETAVGRESEFVTRVDTGVVNLWRNRMGAAWGNLHHYCAGVTYADRARAERDPVMRDHLYKESITEWRYTMARTPDTHPLFAEMATRMGMSYKALRQPEEALAGFDLAIDKCATCPGGYQGKALLYRDQSRLELARDTLVAGNKATGGESAEIHYFLGLVLLDLKDYDGASEHARSAYALGYPLPGLRDKLARAGHAVSQ